MAEARGVPGSTPPESDDARARFDAVVQLIRTRDSSRLPELINLLETERDSRVLGALIRGLGRFGTADEIPRLAEFIDHPDAPLRMAVIEALIDLESPRALPLLFPFLSDPDPEVRKRCLAVLNRLGNKNVLSVLKRMVRNDQRWMRAHALKALSLLDPAVSRPLIRVLIDDPDPKIREGARRIDTAPDPGHSPFSKTHGALDGGVSQDGPETRRNLLEALERAIQQRDRASLDRFVTDVVHLDRFVRSRLMSSIGLIADHDRISVLVDHLEDADPRVVANAIQGLCLLKDCDSLNQIRLHLLSLTTRIRCAAILYVSRLDGCDVGNALAELFRSPDLLAKVAALVCLASLPDRPASHPIQAVPSTSEAPVPGGPPFGSQGLASPSEHPWPDLLALLGETLDTADPERTRGDLLDRARGLDLERFTYGRLILDELTRVQPSKGHGGLTAEDPAFITGADLFRSRRTGRYEDPQPPKSVSSERLRHDEPEESEKIKISARKWRSLLVASRITATLTDIVLFTLPVIITYVTLDRIGGGVPDVLGWLLVATSLGLFLVRDFPGGTGVGKGIMGLAVESTCTNEPIPALAPLLRQIPVILVPWGLAELWLAGRQHMGQRWIDRHCGIRIAARGYPRLDRLAMFWLGIAIMCAILYWLIQKPQTIREDDVWALVITIPDLADALVHSG